MAASIVQSAFARGNSGTLTATLAAAPTIGNFLVLVVLGDVSFGAGNFAPPPASTLLYSEIGQYQGVWVYGHEVAAGDGAAWSISSVGNWENLGVFEISGISSLKSIAAGVTGYNNATGTSFATPAMTAQPSTSLRLFGLVWNSSAAENLTTVPANFTALSPSAWAVGLANGENATIYSVADTVVGVQTFDWGGAADWVAVLEIAVAAAPAELQVTKVNAYTVLTVPDAGVTKANAYAVLTVPDAGVTKLIAYAVVFLPPLPPRTAREANFPVGFRNWPPAGGRSWRVSQ